jgi:hypothetical protein
MTSILNFSETDFVQQFNRGQLKANLKSLRMIGGLEFPVRAASDSSTSSGVGEVVVVADVLDVTVAVSKEI